MRLDSISWRARFRRTPCTSASGPYVLPDPAVATRDLPPFFEQVIKGAHSVVTVRLVDAAGQPTLAARDAILAWRLGKS